jgi:hypothetical protein
MALGLMFENAFFNRENELNGPVVWYIPNPLNPMYDIYPTATFLPKYLLSSAFHLTLMIFPKVFTALIPVLRSFSPQINLSFKLFLS